MLEAGGLLLDTDPCQVSLVMGESANNLPRVKLTVKTMHVYGAQIALTPR